MRIPVVILDLQAEIQLTFPFQIATHFECRGALTLLYAYLHNIYFLHRNISVAVITAILCYRYCKSWVQMIPIFIRMHLSHAGFVLERLSPAIEPNQKTGINGNIHLPCSGRMGMAGFHSDRFFPII